LHIYWSAPTRIGRDARRNDFRVAFTEQYLPDDALLSAPARIAAMQTPPIGFFDPIQFVRIK